MVVTDYSEADILNQINIHYANGVRVRLRSAAVLGFRHRHHGAARGASQRLGAEARCRCELRPAATMSCAARFSCPP